MFEYIEDTWSTSKKKTQDNKATRPVSGGSICWTCMHSVPNKEGTIGCSWSTRLIPVEGWDAIRDENLDSYFVKKCPKWERG